MTMTSNADAMAISTSADHYPSDQPLGRLPASPTYTFGTKAYKIDFRDHLVWVDDVSEPAPLDPSSLQIFNPSILPLPRRSAWRFVAAMRSFRELQVRNQLVQDYKIIAIGLDMTAEGQYFAVSDGLILDIPNPSPRAKGVDDPRLFYTDTGTPAMTFVRVENHHDHNHGGTMFFVEDIRDLYPALDESMVTGGIVPPRQAAKPAGWKVARQLVRESGMQKMWEKNWLSLYPDPKPKQTSTLPRFMYRASPLRTLVARASDRRRILYADIVSADATYADLIGRVHAELVTRGTAEVRGSAGLVRLTLGGRFEVECEHDDGDTVGLGIMHVREGHIYHHFAVMYSLSSPFAPISVGPQFKLADIDDGALLFIVSLTPVPREVPREGGTGERIGILPDHLFLDDRVTLGFGRNDQETMTLTVDVAELLTGMGNVGRRQTQSGSAAHGS